MRDVRVTTLANGLRVVTDAMPGVESVSVGVYVDVGTRHEPAEAHGVAHLLEHMLFKGTRRRDARRIAEEIEAVGGHLNAYTGREQTAYYARVLKADLPLAVDMIADILLHSIFDETELSRERSVVLQEIGQAEDTPDDIIFDHVQAVAYPDQPLGRPVLGSAKIVEKLPRASILAYLGRCYRAGDMVLAAAGNLAHERVVELAERHLAALAPGKGNNGPRAVYRGGDRREERDLEQVHLVLALPGVAHDDPTFYAHGVMSNLLGGGMSSRLFQEIREKRGLAYAIHSFSSSFRDGGLFGIYAGTGEREAPEVVALICAELKRAAATLTEDEVQRSRAQIKANLLMGLESSGARCEQIAHHLLLFNRVLPLEELIADVDAVDLAAAQQATARLFSGPPTFAALGPLAKVPSGDEIARLLA